MGQVGSQHSLHVVTKLTKNLLSATIPLQIGNLHSLQYVDLSHNLLRGELPSEPRNLQNLETLYLSRQSSKTC